MEKKVAKAVEINEFIDDWECIPRSYGYEVKLYYAEGYESENIAWTLYRLTGCGNYDIYVHKTYESIKFRLNR